MKTYQHTQRGPLIVLLLIGIAIVIACVAWLKSEPGLYAGSAIALLTLFAFGSLTIEISDTELLWHFGSGLFRKKVSLSDLATIKVVKTNILEGWGIHFTPRFGWLYNIAGYDAVAITLKNGKRFALGTDEPGLLSQSITTAVKP